MNVRETDPNIDVVSFGCRLNAYESEVMRDHALNAGLRDTVIVNTCAVTKEAERQGLQAIRRLKRERPGVSVIATGCAVQLAPEKYADMPEVARVIGNEPKLRRESWLAWMDQIHRRASLETDGDGWSGTGLQPRCLPWRRGNRPQPPRPAPAARSSPAVPGSTTEPPGRSGPGRAARKRPASRRPRPGSGRG